MVEDVTVRWITGGDLPSTGPMLRPALPALRLVQHVLLGPAAALRNKPTFVKLLQVKDEMLQCPAATSK